MNLRRNTYIGLRGVLAAGAILGACLFGGPAVLAGADPDTDSPVINCDAAGYQRVAAGVALATADYLDAHPDVRDVYTRLKSDNVRPSEEVNAYLEGRPDVAADMSELRQPLKDLMIRCGWGVPAAQSTR